MKKLVTAISIILIVSLIATNNVFALDSQCVDADEYVAVLEDAYIYAIKTSTKSAVVVLFAEGADISIVYTSAPNVTYQWRYSNEVIPNRHSNTREYGKSIIEYAENNIDDAIQVIIENVDYDEPIDITQSRLTTTAVLKAQLREIMGQDEYTGRLRTTTPIIIGGVSFRVYENLEFFIVNSGYIHWSTNITVSSIIVNLLGYAVGNGIVGVICLALGIAINVYATVGPGGLNKFTCTAYDLRYVTADGYPGQVFNTTYKNISYMAYEDSNQNSTGIAQIYEDSQSIVYTDGVVYFYSFDQQAQSAYNNYFN